jgi:hypothetical protein
VLTATLRTWKCWPGRRRTSWRDPPTSFRCEFPFGITVVIGRTKPNYEGYDAIDPIVEVLVDVGMIADERLEDWERELQDLDAGERYAVTLERARAR